MVEQEAGPQYTPEDVSSNKCLVSVNDLTLGITLHSATLKEGLL
jgi:hypothetical protein